MNLYGKNYKLVWEDHFDKEAIDPGYWDVLHYNVPGHEERPAWRKRENCTVENSNLVIRGKIEENGDYSSGMLRGHGHLAYLYGYAEIRAKMPLGGPGIWPGFWLVRPQYNNQWMTTTSEIDVLEMFGDDSYLACNIHSWWTDPEAKDRKHVNYLDGQGYPKKIYLPDGAKFSEDYHTIGYEWTPDIVAFYVDGEPYCTIRVDNPVFRFIHQPMYFILSMAFGLKHVAKPDEDRTEPIEYFIDYIRLYQNEDGKLYHVDEDNELREITDLYALSELK